MTDVYEGSLIRLFRRLEELLRQIAQASKVMGSEELEQKFTAALELVRRDLVSALGNLHMRCSLLTWLAGGCPIAVSLSEVTGHQHVYNIGNGIDCGCTFAASGKCWRPALCSPDDGLLQEKEAPMMRTG